MSSHHPFIHPSSIVACLLALETVGAFWHRQANLRMLLLSLLLLWLSLLVVVVVLMLMTVGKNHSRFPLFTLTCIRVYRATSAREKESLLKFILMSSWSTKITFRANAEELLGNESLLKSSLFDCLSSCLKVPFFVMFQIGGGFNGLSSIKMEDGLSASSIAGVKVRWNLIQTRKLL